MFMHLANRGAVLVGCVTALGSDFGGQLGSKDVMIKPREDILQRTRATSSNVLCFEATCRNKQTLYVFRSASQLIPTTGYHI